MGIELLDLFLNITLANFEKVGYFFFICFGICFVPLYSETFVLNVFGLQRSPKWDREEACFNVLLLSMVYKENSLRKIEFR